MTRIRPDMIIAAIVIVTAGLVLISNVLAALWVGWLLGVWSAMFAMRHPRPEPPTRPRVRAERPPRFDSFVRAVKSMKRRHPDESARDPKPDTDWFPAEPVDVGEDEGP
jgi:hypothetical protein